MIKQEDIYGIGRIGKPHGVKGEMQFQFEDDVFDRTDADYLILNINGLFVPFFIEAYRFRSNTTALIKFSDIDTEAQARELTGCRVFFPRRMSPEGDDDYSSAEIIGFRVVDHATSRLLGSITAVDESTANTLFRLSTPDNGELLIPANIDLIRSVDKSARLIVMDIPDGLLNL